MIFPDRKTVEKVRQEYPVGSRVELISMHDPYTMIPEGTQGTVRGVDDVGTIFVNWDCGSGLGIVYGEDSCRKLAYN